MKKLYIFVFFTLLFNQLFAQKSVFGVNTSTGTGVAQIPIYNVSDGAVNLPVSVTYRSSGVKTKDVESSAGMNWQLQAGGAVSRQIRGLPDDCRKDIAGNARLGWLYNTDAAKINSFSISNDNNASTCPDETTDINYLNTNFADFSDTEPDLFFVNAPGLSCQLVFDSNHIPHPITYQDITISLTYQTNTADSRYGAITSFTIVNDKGIRYVFSVAESSYQQSYASTVQFGTGTPLYFLNRYNQFLHGVAYYDNWFLKSMTDANGNGVVLNYTALNPTANGGLQDSIRTSWDDLILYKGAASNATTQIKQYTMQSGVTPQRLIAVQTTDHGRLTPILSFNWSPIGAVNQNIIQSIALPGRILYFDYTAIISSDSQGTYGRYFLKGLREANSISPVSYKFDYATNPNGTVVLGDSTSFHTDYWGYCSANGFTDPVPTLYVNPSNPMYQRYVLYGSATAGSDYSYTLGAHNKTVDPVNIVSGMLSKITYNDGGTTSIAYEPNDYLDIPSNTVIQGGGVRVNHTTDYDGGSTSNNIVTNYAYLNPSTNVSSGKPLSLPVYGFTTPYTGTATGADYWNYSTIRSANDLSDEDHSILYQYVKVSRPGAGSTLYQYYVPATNWDNTASPACSGCTADWNPTINYTGRNSCAAYGSVKNDIDTYPFTPNVNYNFERGLLIKESMYNEAAPNNLVSETNYTYQRTSSPQAINALKFDANNGVTAYAKYQIYYNTSELTSQVSKTVYDLPSFTTAKTSISNYTYGSSYHKLIKQQTTNSDNSIISINTTYSKDYPIAATGADSTVNALYHLQKQNINAPIEIYTQVTRGTTTKTINASLTKYKTFAFPGNTYTYCPVQTLKLILPDGGSFTPFSVNTGIAVADPQYFPTANYTFYDNSGILQTADDANKHVNTVLTDFFYNQPIALFKNAAFNEIGFDNFTSTQPVGSRFTNAIAYSSLGSAQLLFNSGQSLSKSIVKKTGESVYILSAWLSSTASGTINVSLTNSSNVTTSYAEPVTNTGNVYKYFEWAIPVSSITGNFTVTLSTSSSMYLQNLSFYPQTAEATTYTYDNVAHFKTSETNTNGVTNYYTNDLWGRLSLRYDQDKNLIEKRTYTNNNSITTGLPSPTISYSPASPNTSAPVIFNAYNSPDITGVTYTWNFGDGTTATALNGNQQQHTYTSVGTYTVTVSASNATYGTATQSILVLISAPPVANLVAHICASGATSWDNCLHKAITVEACGNSPSDATTSYYTIYLVDGAGSGTLHYQWQTSANNGTSWTAVGTDAALYSQACAPKNTQYLTRCIVSSSSGQTPATSPYVNFTVQQCQ